MPVDTTTLLSQVETDAFCDCGYNLHGQPVWRDDRLDIFVCRCPECGRHAAAGRFTGIHANWLHRLSFALILSWVLFLLALFAFLTPMCAVWPNEHFHMFLTVEPMPNPGGASPTPYEWTFHHFDADDMTRVRVASGVMLALAAANGLVIGACVATFLWHLRRRAYLFLIPPMIVLAIVYVAWVVDGSYPIDRVSAWLAYGCIGYAFLESACVLAGLQIGRPLARFTLRLLLPDRLLQHLAFLWYRDGKPLPLKHPQNRVTGPLAQPRHVLP